MTVASLRFLGSEHLDVIAAHISFRVREREREKVFTPQMQYFVLILKTVPLSIGGKKKKNQFCIYRAVRNKKGMAL